MTQSLNQYYIFYTAAMCGNFSAASRKLFISQPAVSKAILLLEEELGTSLFVRTAKGVRLTETGELLVRQLDTAFRAIRLGEEQIKKSVELGEGRLSIGVSTTMCKYVLLPYLRFYRAKNPHVRMSISCQSSHETIAGLENGSLDLGLIGKSDHMEKLHFQPLMDISDVFVCTAKYKRQLLERLHLSEQDWEEADKEEDFSGRNSEKGNGLKVQKESEVLDNLEHQLFGQATLLLLDKNNITRQYVEKYLLSNQIVIGQQIEVTTMDLLIDFAKIGLGVACVVKEFVEKELKEGSLVLFPIKEPIPSRQIGFAYPKNIQPGVAVEEFLKLRREASIG